MHLDWPFGAIVFAQRQMYAPSNFYAAAVPYAHRLNHLYSNIKIQ